MEGTRPPALPSSLTASSAGGHRAQRGDVTAKATGCSHRTPQVGWFMKSRHLFLAEEEAGHPRPGCWQVCRLVTAPWSVARSLPTLNSTSAKGPGRGWGGPAGQRATLTGGRGKRLRPSQRVPLPWKHQPAEVLRPRHGGTAPSSCPRPSTHLATGRWWGVCALASLALGPGPGAWACTHPSPSS